MLVFNILLYISCEFIFLCYGVEEEYYINERNIENYGIHLNETARRTSKDRHQEPQSKLFILDDDYEQEDFIYYDNGKREQPDQLSRNISQVKNKNIISAKNLIISATEQQPKNISLSNLLKEYDYMYGDDNDLNVLRESVDGSILQNNDIQINNDDEVKTPFAKFYNLDPAVDQEITNTDRLDIQHRSWYILHNSPCWNLPILFGEKLYAAKDVFSLYGERLKNVKDHGVRRKHVYKPVVPTVSHTVNTWCEVEPCYGDHTLCLFSDNIVAKICSNNGYKVMAPTILEQITIVNTINSMRNRVANGLSKRYSHLPTAANMKQVIYDYDLERMSKAWLRQCLPGPAPCSALDNKIVSELECTKFAKFCCHHTLGTLSKCTPRSECFLFAVVGCIYTWFWRAGEKLIKTDIECGRASVFTYDAVQLLWAETTKIGCAYGEDVNGDIRVICNFAPGAPFFLDTKLYCGIISYTQLRQYDRHDFKITEKDFLHFLSLKWNSISTPIRYKKNVLNAKSSETIPSKEATWGINTLNKIYKEGWARKQINDWTNGTSSWVARLVVKYTFVDKSESRCDSDETIYKIGEPGTLCIEKGRTYHGLCYDFRDPTPGYRIIAVIAPIILFSLILYDLFSGVVRQTNY